MYKMIHITIDPSKIEKNVLGYIGVIELNEASQFRHAYELLIHDIPVAEAIAAGVRLAVGQAVTGDVDATAREIIQSLVHCLRANDQRGARLWGRALRDSYRSHPFMVVTVDETGALLERAPREIADVKDVFSARKRFRNAVKGFAEAQAYITVHPED